MIIKALFLLVALSYVHSSPINTVVDPVDDNKIVLSDKLTSVVSDNVQPSVALAPAPTLPHETPKIVNADEEVHETRSARVARENKVEYLYVDSEGKMRQVGIPKNAIRINPLLNVPADELVVDLPTRSVEKPILPAKVNPQPNLVELTAKSASTDADKLTDPSSSSLQYASGNLKVRNEIKSRITNGVPQLSGQQQQSSPLISPFVQSIYPNDLNILQGYPAYNPLISPLYTPYSYPLNYPLVLQNAYNPLLTAASSVLQPGLLARSSPIVNSLSPEELEVRRALQPYNNLDLIPSFISNLPYLFQNRLISPTNLFGRTLNSLIYSPSLLHNTPYINPFIPYALPQQTPNLNYLLGRSALVGAPTGLNGGYDGYPYNSYTNYLGGYSYPQYPQYSNIYSPYMPSSVYPNLVNNLLYPGLAQNYYPSLYPQYLPQTGLNYPYSYQPLYNQPQPSILPQTQPLVQPQVALNPQEFSSRRVSTTTSTSSSPTTVSNSPTSSDSVIQPFSDSIVNNVPSVVIPGETVETTSGEKPLLYSNQNQNQNQNAALRSPYYDSSYLGSNYNSAYYSRLIDPLTGLPYYRYPSSGYQGYYGSRGYYGPAYSSIYRPGYIGTYPPGYLNGYHHGILPYSSMHYSADPTDLLSRSGKSDEKVSSTSKDQSKESNLMYSIKTSKSESKETVSRMNQEAPKMSLDDNKKA